MIVIVLMNTYPLLVSEFSSVSSSNPVTAVLMDAAPLRRAAYLERNTRSSLTSRG